MSDHSPGLGQRHTRSRGRAMADHVWRPCNASDDSQRTGAPHVNPPSAVVRVSHLRAECNAATEANTHAVPPVGEQGPVVGPCYRIVQYVTYIANCEPHRSRHQSRDTSWLVVHRAITVILSLLPPSPWNAPARPAARAGCGFTLIEVMIAVAIVAVLTTLAYGSYIKYVVRTNRAAAEGYLLEVTGLQQRYLLDARTYATSLAALNSTPPTNLATIYNFDFGTTLPTASTFTATATPIAGTVQANNDSGCGQLTITQDGTKSATGPSGAARCWQQ